MEKEKKEDIMGDIERLEFLKQIYKDCRAEIEMRISQRDNFSIQFIIAVGATFALGFLEYANSAYMFFLLPLLSLFYTIQILYSYVIHDRLHKFLVSNLEPEIASLLNYNEIEKDELFWESYCDADSKKRSIKAPGIRKGFFKYTSLLMPFIAAALFIGVGISKEMFQNASTYHIIAWSFCTVYLLADLWVLARFEKKSTARGLKKLACVDFIDKRDVWDKRPKKVVFLDRDGTIHVDKIMAHDPKDLEYFTDTFTALKKLSDLGYKLIVVSNQNGIRDGFYGVQEMREFNAKLLADLRENGVAVSAVYYSPYNETDGHISFKPSPGMLIRAMYELNVDMAHSYMVGDQISDVVAGSKAGVKSIMVTTGLYKDGTYANAEYKKISPITVSCLGDAAEFIQNDV